MSPPASLRARLTRRLRPLLPDRPWRRLALAIAGVVLAPLLAFLLADLAFPFPWERLHRPPSLVLTDRDGTELRIVLAADQRWRLPTPLTELPSELPPALVAIEDRFFGWHPGVNPLAIVRAALTNLGRGRVVSGGSTLAMQLARLAEPGPRTLPRKLREAFRAVQLTWHLEPAERLQAYLDLAPYGRNVEGVGAASRLLFGKPPGALSLGEIALLVALPRAPNGLDPVRRPDAARRVRDAVLARLVALGVVGAEEADRARRQPLPAAYTRAPRHAPHATDLLAGRWRRAEADRSPAAGSDRSAPMRPARLRTTLDLRVQTLAEERVRSRIGGLRQVGVGNAAVVVLTIPEREVLAMVGSADHADVRHQGQVNGTLARRSHGSTLKPFLFGLAYDDGRLLPASYLLDVPTDFRGYVAENYDGLYRGRVTAHDALVQSLNASTVRLLADLSVERFLALLRDGGLSTLDRPAAEYGLPLALGAGEVNLVELTNLYATLGDAGRHAPYRLLLPDATPSETAPGLPDPPAPTVPADSASPPRRQLLSAETVTFLLRALSELRRPDLPGTWQLASGAPEVAWKTGTSFGHRDAWAIGVSGHHAIGVWVGNFDGRAVRGISGAEHAGPILFDLFRALEPGATLPWPPAPRIEPLAVCALSHELPGPACDATVTVEYVPGRSRLAGCRLHRQAIVDRRSGELLLGDCLAGRSHRTAVLTVYPPELTAFWKATGQTVPPTPPLAADCRGIPGGEGPQIVSPDTTTPYRLRADAPLAHQRIALLARAGPEARILYWYLDGELIATGVPGEPDLAAIGPGRHRVAVVDDTGRRDSVTIEVQAASRNAGDG